MNNKEQDLKFIQKAISLANEGVKHDNGGPFGAIIVRDGEIIASGNNCVTSKNDPTAHAEIEAIRKACEISQSFSLEGCTIYTSCEPCPMCLSAIYWAHISRIVYACTREDAAAIQFDDDFIYKEIALPVEKRSIPMEQVGRIEGLGAFDTWVNKQDKIRY